MAWDLIEDQECGQWWKHVSSHAPWEARQAFVFLVFMKCRKLQHLISALCGTPLAEVLTAVYWEIFFL